MPTAALVIIIVVAIAVVLAIAVVAMSFVAERRHPPIGMFLDVDGVRLHYIERGARDAPAVVLLHGNGSMIQDFLASGLVDLLARRYRVLCFDRPGFGYSRRPRRDVWTPERQARTFALALAALGAHNPLVLAHSWGTLVALALAGHGSSVRGLVLVGGYYFPSTRLDVWISSGPALPVIGDLMCYTISPILGYLLAPVMIRALFAPRRVPDRFANGFPIALALRPKQLRATAEESAVMVASAARLSTGYVALPCPIALFQGDGDRVIEPDQAPRLHGLAPRSVMHIVHATGHMIHYAIPDDLAAAVDEMHASTGAALERSR